MDAIAQLEDFTNRYTRQPAVHVTKDPSNLKSDVRTAVDEFVNEKVACLITLSNKAAEDDCTAQEILAQWLAYSMAGEFSDDDILAAWIEHVLNEDGYSESDIESGVEYAKNNIKQLMEDAA